MYMLIIGAGAGSYAAYQLLVSATSDMLGLKTLRHGTSPINYLNIHLYGANPGLGGGNGGEAYLLGYQGNKANEGRFFVWNDDFHEVGNVNHCGLIKSLLNNSFLHPLVKRLGGKYYSVIGGMSSCTFKNIPMPINKICQLVGGVLGLITPTLHFHCTPEEWKDNFIVDSNLHPVASYTQKPMNGWKYMGLTGVCYQGFSRGMCSRMAQNSKGIAKGLVKLLVVMSLVLSILAVLATQLQIRVYNIYNQIQVFTQIDQNTLYIISMALPFFALAIT